MPQPNPETASERELANYGRMCLEREQQATEELKVRRLIREEIEKFFAAPGNELKATVFINIYSISSGRFWTGSYSTKAAADADTGPHFVKQICVQI